MPKEQNPSNDKTPQSRLTILSTLTAGLTDALNPGSAKSEPVSDAGDGGDLFTRLALTFGHNTALSQSVNPTNDVAALNDAFENGKAEGREERQVEIDDLIADNEQLDTIAGRLTKKLAKRDETIAAQKETIGSLSDERDSALDRVALSEGESSALKSEVDHLRNDLSRAHTVDHTIRLSADDMHTRVALIELRSEVDTLRSDNASLTAIIEDYRKTPTSSAPDGQVNTIAALREQLAAQNKEIIALKADNDKQQQIRLSAEQNATTYRQDLTEERTKSATLLKENTTLRAQNGTATIQLQTAKGQKQQLAAKVENTETVVESQQEEFDTKIEEFSGLLKKAVPMITAFKTLAVAMRLSPEGLIGKINSGLSSKVTPTGEKKASSTDSRTNESGAKAVANDLRAPLERKVSVSLSSKYDLSDSDDDEAPTKSGAASPKIRGKGTNQSVGKVETLSKNVAK